MNKEQLSGLIDSGGETISERLTGNEENAILGERMAPLVETERPVVVELLRDWISVRIPKSERQPGDGVHVGALFLALEVGRRYSLHELRPDIEALIADVQAGKTYLPYYADMIARYLP